MLGSKCLSINLLEPTKHKQKLLLECYNTFYRIVLEILEIKKNNPNLSRKDIQKLIYNSFREKYNIASQLVIETKTYAWNVRKQGKISKVVVRFDKRLFSLKKTKRKNPVLSLRVNSERIAIPIKQDGAYKRLLEHIQQGWEITSIFMTKDLKFYATLKKEFPEPKIMPNVLGIDVNARWLAVSVYNPRTERWQKQLYLGKDISLRQIKYEQRRAKLQHYKDKFFDSKAGGKFRMLGGKQRNYVKTRVWQVVSEIIKLAKENYATIAIEDIKHLRVRKGEINKKGRKKINRIPYGLFRFVLEHKAMQEGIKVIAINPKYTSQTCPRCGKRRKSTQYNYFRCECGFEANRDRTASQNICLRASRLLPSITAQYPEAGAAVNQPVWSYEG